MTKSSLEGAKIEIKFAWVPTGVGPRRKNGTDPDRVNTVWLQRYVELSRDGVLETSWVFRDTPRWLMRKIIKTWFDSDRTLIISDRDINLFFEEIERRDRV